MRPLWMCHHQWSTPQYKHCLPSTWSSWRSSSCILSSPWKEASCTLSLGHHHYLTYFDSSSFSCREEGIDEPNDQALHNCSNQCSWLISSWWRMSLSFNQNSHPSWQAYIASWSLSQEGQPHKDLQCCFIYHCLNLIISLTSSYLCLLWLQCLYLEEEASSSYFK